MMTHSISEEGLLHDDDEKSGYLKNQTSKLMKNCHSIVNVVASPTILNRLNSLF